MTDCCENGNEHLVLHKRQRYSSLADKVSTYHKGLCYMDFARGFWLVSFVASNLIIAKKTVTNLKIFSVQFWPK